MSIWVSVPNLTELNEASNEINLCASLGIKLTEVGDDFLRATMPADERSFQPYGVVHGGANVVLAETLGSLASAYCVDRSKFVVLGQEVNASHLRPVSSGLVTATARAIHLGRQSHVWEIRMENDDGKLTCISKLTMAVVPFKS
jgi:1,4-dihydroxy-2-naphthoyl-CoA hydrolase